MPSPIGHALAGVLTAWVADLVPGPRSRPTDPIRVPDSVRLTLICALLAVAPDVDLLFAGHRTITHSIGAVMLVGVWAAVVAGRVGWPVTRIALMCTAAYASHVFLDWLAVDRTVPRGVQALWPLDHHWYISGWDLFRPTERQHVFTAAAIRQNTAAIAQEIVLLAPLLAVVSLTRRRRLSKPKAVASLLQDV